MKFSELKANWKWMLEHMPEDEPVVFPRRNAMKRVANKEKRRRIIFDVDPTGYQEFHAMREAYMRYCDENPTLVALAIIAAMKDFNLKAWLEEQEDAKDEQDMDKSNAL